MTVTTIETRDRADVVAQISMDSTGDAGSVREFPATRAGALEFLELMGVEVPHVWYSLLGAATAMREVCQDPRLGEESAHADEVLAAMEWWRQEPFDALIPALPDRDGHYWVSITDDTFGSGLLIDTFPLFRGVMDTDLPDFVLQGVLEARGYADVSELAINPPPTGVHAGETQQYAPVNIVREVLPREVGK